MAATVALFAQMLLDPDIERAERRRVLAFIPLSISAVAFRSIHSQAFGALAVYSDLRIDRTIGDWTAPAAWAQSLNPVFTLLLILPLAALRLPMGRRAPDIPIQMIVGTALSGVSSTRYEPTDSGAERMYFLFVGIGVIAVATVAATVLPWIRRLIADDPDSMAAAPTAGDETPARVEPPQTPTPGSCR